MAEALAKDNDMNAGTTWSTNSLRDLLTSLINANDRRYEHEFRRAEEARLSLELRLNEKIADLDRLQTTISAGQEKAVSAALAAAEKAVAAALAAAEKAVLKSEVSANERFAAVNEFRSTLTDQASKFVTRNEVDASLKAQADKLIDIVSRFDRMEANVLTTHSVKKEGSDHTAWLVTTIVAVLTAAVSVGLSFFKK